MHLSGLCRIIYRLFVMGGASAYLSASKPVSPPGHLRPHAALVTPNQFRPSSGLKPQEYSQPVLGLIFLRFVEVPQDATGRFDFEGRPIISF